MGAILALFFVVAPIALSVIAPVFLIYLSLLTGGLPLSFGRDEMVASPLWRLDFSAIRLLGLWLAASIVVSTHFARGWKYILIFRFHLFFLSFCCLALLWSPSYIYGIRMIAKLSAPFLFMLLVMLVISTVDQLKWMERLMITSALLIIAVAIITKLTGHNSDHRLTIPNMSPAVFSAHLTAVCILMLSNFKQNHSTKNLVLTCLFSAAIILAFTRITIGALFIAFSVMLFMAYRGLPRVILPISGLIGLPALFFLNERFKSRMFIGANKVTLEGTLNNPMETLGRVHGSGRFAAWSDVLQKFFEPSPLIGSGVGATQNYFYSYSVTGLGVIHSEYVRLLAEVGLFGLILFVIAVLFYMFRLFRIYRNESDLDTQRYTLAAAGAIIAYLVFMATDNAFDYVNAFGIYVFALIAMTEKAMEIKLEQREAMFSKNSSSGSDDVVASVLSGVGGKRVRRYQILYKD